MGFRPLHDRVLIRRLAPETKTPRGIIIPDAAQEKPMEGEVVSCGPGARGEDGKLVPMEVKAGDRVLFGKWSGTEVRLGDEELIIMREADIIADLTSNLEEDVIGFDESAADLDSMFERLDEGITTERRAMDHLLKNMSENTEPH